MGDLGIMRSNVPQMKKVARNIHEKREVVLNRFSTRASRGFMDTGRFTTMIFLNLGRLDFSAQLASACATH